MNDDEDSCWYCCPSDGTGADAIPLFGLVTAYEGGGGNRLGSGGVVVDGVIGGVRGLPMRIPPFVPSPGPIDIAHDMMFCCGRQP